MLIEKFMRRFDGVVVPIENLWSRAGTETRSCDACDLAARVPPNYIQLELIYKSSVRCTVPVLDYLSALLDGLRDGYNPEGCQPAEALAGLPISRGALEVKTADTPLFAKVPEAEYSRQGIIVGPGMQARTFVALYPEFTCRRIKRIFECTTEPLRPRVTMQVFRNQITLVGTEMEILKAQILIFACAQLKVNRWISKRKVTNKKLAEAGKDPHPELFHLDVVGVGAAICEIAAERAGNGQSSSIKAAGWMEVFLLGMWTAFSPHFTSPPCFSDGVEIVKTYQSLFACIRWDDAREIVRTAFNGMSVFNKERKVSAHARNSVSMSSHWSYPKMGYLLDMNRVFCMNPDCRCRTTGDKIFENKGVCEIRLLPCITMKDRMLYIVCAEKGARKPKTNKNA